MAEGEENRQAAPIVKWAGGKRKLLPVLLAHVPSRVYTYVEPFAGGAALFFALANERRFTRAALGDQNAELVACYRAVRDDVDGVIAALRGYRYDREMFEATRALDTDGMSDVERAARFVYLNRTCFNGLWRVNSKGKFNVPFGRYTNPTILDEPGLRTASAALARVDLHHADFAEVTAAAGAGDFVYFDPPYVPVSTTANFTGYVAGGFGPGDQRRLVAELSRLRERGVFAMLSNADTEETRALYSEFAVHVVKVARAINSDATKRGAVRELVVTTWGDPGVCEAA